MAAAAGDDGCCSMAIGANFSLGVNVAVAVAAEERRRWR